MRKTPLVVVCPECRQLRVFCITGCLCADHGPLIACTADEYDQAVREYHRKKSWLARRIIGRSRRVVLNCDAAIKEAAACATG